MPLSVRTNGSSSPNIISASWFNDIRDLLVSGVMQDQEIWVKNNVLLQSTSGAPSSAPLGVAISGSGMSTGAYQWFYTYMMNDGESLPSPILSLSTTSGHDQVALTGITTGPTGCTGRKIYRTKVGGGTAYTTYGYVATISDNITTAYTDTTPDGSLGSPWIGSPAFGGSILGKDVGSALIWQIYGDGTFAPKGVSTSYTGSISGTAQGYFPIWGTGLKVMVIGLNNYNHSTSNNFYFPTPLLSGGWLFVPNLGATMRVAMFKAGSLQSDSVLTALGTTSAAGTSGASSNIYGNSIIEVTDIGADQFQVGQPSTALTCTFLFVGF